MENTNYYKEFLNSNRLLQAYDTKIPRVKQFLSEEINFVRKRLTGNESVLELGAGYGRIVKELAPYAGNILGIDISNDSIEFGRKYISGIDNAKLEVMDAYNIPFEEEFDVTLCMQNGISAIKGNQMQLIENALKATKQNGTIYISTYSEKFWEYRLEWFQEQVDKGLLGEIDFEKTGNGEIHCKDGFKATTFSEDDFREIGEKTGYKYEVIEVDQSSLFLVVWKD